MGCLKTIALAGALTCLGTAGAFAADYLPPPPQMYQPAPAPVEFGGGWYLRGDVGVGSQEIGKVSGADVERDGGSFYRKSLADTAFVGAGVGYQFSSFLRFDVTGEYRTATKYDTSDKFKYNRFFGYREVQTNLTNRYTGDLQSSVFLANGYFDLGTWYGITPFVGAGVGVAHHRIRNAFDNGLIYNFDAATGEAINTEATGGIAADASKTNFAWAVHAGLAYQVSPALKLELAYRYLNMGDAQTGTLSCGVVCNTGQTFSPLRLKNIESHDFKIGMRWMLGVPVAYSEPPPPGPLVRKY